VSGPACAAGRRLPVSVLAVYLALAVSTGVGCASADPAPAAVVSAAPPERMSVDARASLPAGFPREVPVLAATIVSGEATGDPLLGPWHVTLASDVPADLAAAWYRDTFGMVGWDLAGEQPVAGGVALVLVKGAGAWTTVRVRDAGPGSTIEMWVGLGVPVPPQAMPEGLDSI